jgi:hypothetical protein
MRSAVATAPIDTNVKILAQRLLALRTEIDAILEELASQNAACAGAELADAPEQLPIIEAPAPTEALASPPTSHAEATEDAVDEDDTAFDASLADIATDEARKTFASSSAAELTPIAAVEADQVVSEAAATTQEAEQTDREIAAVEPLFAPDGEPRDRHEDRVLADDATAVRAADAAETPAQAAVINLDARRQDRQMALAAAMPAKGTGRRRQAAKIAACILAMAALGTLLFADLAALGSAPSLSRALSAPPEAPFASGWSFLRLWQGADQSRAPDETKVRAGFFDVEGYTTRYREAWPSGS